MVSLGSLPTLLENSCLPTKQKDSHSTFSNYKISFQSQFWLNTPALGKDSGACKKYVEITLSDEKKKERKREN